MKVVTVVGNRPQLVKAAAVSRHLRDSAEEVLVHSGQHYDRELSQVFFEELGVPAPAVNLEVGSGSHAAQTATIMTRLEPVLEEAAPGGVLVYGDTNTTLAAAMVTAKMGLPLAHVEAGMRSFSPAMPEEVNRVAVDRLAGLLLCPTAVAVENLDREGMGERARLVGDVMADIAIELGPVAERRSGILETLGLTRGEFLLATLHRAGNVDDVEALGRAVDLLLAVAEDQGPLVLPLHPHTRARLSEAGLLGALEGAGPVRPCDPLGYLDFTALLRNAQAVLTDSGGLQKEAYLAGVPCVTLREETEWVETVECGWNRVVGLDAGRALEALGGIDPSALPRPDPGLYGGGEAGGRVAEALLDWAGARAAR